MSGLEIVGIVASTFQLAEIGIKLSVKLCSFYRLIKDADRSAQRLASDISLTCSILHQLGKTLEQDSQTKLCSQQAFLTAQEVLEECEKIFKQIEDAIEKKDPGSGKSKWERGARRLTIVILGPDLDVLNSHLDRLKSTMLLMLNVIMYAREINRTSDHSSLGSQRQLIETLLREKTETEARLKRMIEVADTRSGCDRKGTLSSSTLIARPDMRACDQPPAENEIDNYYKLVKTLLDEIDVCQTNLQPDRHLRIRDGVVNVHKAEIAIFRKSHGEAVVQAFDCPFFNVYNRDSDSSFASEANFKVPTGKTAPSTQHTYGAHPSSGRRQYPAYDRLKKGDDIDDYEAYSYTTPREQFDRDYPIKLRRPRGRSSVDRPLSMNVMEENPQWLARKDHRHYGPPPTSRGLDKIDREGRPRASSCGVDERREGSRSRGHERALVAVPHESDDGYDSYSDDHRHHRRSRHHSDRHHRDDRSPRPHNGSGEQVLPALGTAALGAGYPDMSDYDHRSARRQHRRQRDSERDHDPSHLSSRDLHDGAQPNADRNNQLVGPGSYRRRPRRSERYPDSDSDVYTDDEDLRRYRREPSAAPHSRHSSTDPNSAEDYPSWRYHERSRHRSSRTQRLLEDGHPNKPRHSSSADSEDDIKKVVAVDPLASRESEAAPKGILKPPRESFPEEPNPVREGVAPLKDAHKNDIPPGAQWTKIGRRLVNPAALEVGLERYEERADYVTVLRVLTKEEVEAYALKTQKIRDARHKERIEEKRRLMDENQRHDRCEDPSSGDEDEGSDECKKNSPQVRLLESSNLPTEPKGSKRSPESLKQQKAHSTQDAKRLLTSSPSHALSNSMLEVKQSIQDSQQKEYLHRGFVDRDNHREDLPGGKASVNCADDKADQNEDGSKEVDTPALGQDTSDFRRETTSPGKEIPRKNVAWETLEDLVLSWTTLSRDMIQL